MKAADQQKPRFLPVPSCTISDLPAQIGHTPLLRLARTLPADGEIEFYGKWEGANPSGSLKDRVVWRILTDALAAGDLKPDRTVVEASSGNTGIAMGMAGAILGLPMRVYMPESKSLERRRMMRYWGVELILTPGDDPNSHISAAERLVLEHPDNYFYLHQNGHPGNVAAHAEGTASEVWEQTRGRVDVVIAALGTSGTLMGLASGLKKRKPALQVIGVQPAHARSRIEGLLYVSPDYKPPIYDPALVDQTVHVSDDDAIYEARALARREGLFCGISSGACVAAARTLGDALNGRVVVVVLGDRGDRYFSTELFKE